MQDATRGVGGISMLSFTLAFDNRYRNLWVRDVRRDARLCAVGDFVPVAARAASVFIPPYDEAVLDSQRGVIMMCLDITCCITRMCVCARMRVIFYKIFTPRRPRQTFHSPTPRASHPQSPIPHNPSRVGSKISAQLATQLDSRQTAQCVRLT